MPTSASAFARAPSIWLALGAVLAACVGGDPDAAWQSGAAGSSASAAAAGALNAGRSFRHELNLIAANADDLRRAIRADAELAAWVADGDVLHGDQVANETWFR